MSSYLGFVIGGYLLGSILFAYVLPKLTRHIDIREMSEDGKSRNLQCIPVRRRSLWNLCAATGTFEGIFTGVAVRADRRSAIPVVCGSNGGACAGTRLFHLSPRARRQGDRGILRGSAGTGAGGNLAAVSDAGAVLSAVFTFA